MKKSKQFLHICLHLLLEPTGLLHKKQTIDSYSRLWLNMSRSKTIQIILFPSKGIEVLYYIYIYTSLSVSKLKYIWIILCIEDVSFRWSESILAMEVLRQMCYIDQRSYKRSLANETHALKLLSQLLSISQSSLCIIHVFCFFGRTKYYIQMRGWSAGWIYKLRLASLVSKFASLSSICAQ